MEPKKKILVFSMSYEPYMGGAEVALKAVMRELALNYDFHIITLRYDSKLPQKEVLDGVVVHRIGHHVTNPTAQVLKSKRFLVAKLAYLFKAAWYARNLQKKEAFDLTFSLMAHSAGVPGALYKILYPKTPFVMWLQEGDPLPHIEKTMRPLWPLFVRAFRRADGIASISTFLADWAKRLGAHVPPKIIPTPLKVSDFKNFFSDDEKNSRRAKLGFTSEDTVLVTTSRLVSKNAVDVVIESLVSLPDKYKFLVVGDGPLRGSLEELVKKLGMDERVKFTGLVPPEKIKEFLWISDIFIRPSRSEGLGISFLEAFAARLPVVATPVGGIPDIVFDPTTHTTPTGLLAKVDDPESVASKILSLEDNTLRKQLIANAFELVDKNFDIAIVSQKMHTLLTDCIIASKR